MRSRTTTLLTSTFALTVVLAGCGAPIVSRGEPTTEERAIGNATEVRLETSGDLTLVVGDEPSLTVTAGENVIDRLTSTMSGSTLVLGFKTQVIEFVSSEATARNILLKCEYGVKPGQPGPVGEYLNLRDWWKVTPWLETRLAERLGPYLERFS